MFLFPAFASAGLIPPLSQVTNALTPAANTALGTVNGTLGSVNNTVGSLGSGTITLPSTPPIDVGGTLDQTINDINGLGLPLQLPQVDVPLTVPGIDPNQIVNGTLPVLGSGSTDPGSGPTAPGSPAPPGSPGMPGPGAPGSAGTVGAPAVGTPLPRTAAQGVQNQTVPANGSWRPDGSVSPLAADPSDPRVSPAEAGGGLSLDEAVRTGLAMLPLLGALCAFLALTAYLKSARNVWNARA